MTKKYIDADAVTEIREIDEEYFDKLERYNGTEFAEGFSEGWTCACDKIAKKIPAADVEEVRHGAWEMIPPSKKYPSGEYVKFRCSECGISFEGSSKYCGCCGARMDGKRLGEVSKDKNTGM